MYISKENIKKELQELCVDYIKILEKLKNNNMISNDEFKKFTDNKILFIEE